MTTQRLGADKIPLEPRGRC